MLFSIGSRSFNTLYLCFMLFCYVKYYYLKLSISVIYIIQLYCLVMFVVHNILVTDIYLFITVVITIVPNVRMYHIIY